jgi:simple sugar transport system substrate-binding protein/ribose transport system substrate-binding protein
VKEVGKFSMARTQSWRDDVRAGMQALLLQNQGKINGIWASFDGQAYIIDDLLQAQGVKKGQIPLVSVDGGKETYARIADPASTFLATVAIPFEAMGKQAVDAIQTIVVEKKPKETVTSGPYLFTEAVLVDKTNVQQFLK